MNQQQDKFNFFVPFELAKGSNQGQEMYIKGVCSSEVEDSDGETLVPAGFDVSPLLATGFLNYNHQSGKNASAIIGEPTKAEIINNGKDLYIEGFLYPDSDEAKAVYKLAKTLEKNSPKRRLGFSIEGKAIEKDPLNPKRITKARITGVAITACPKNPNTLLSIVKGEYAEAFVEEIEKSDLDVSQLVSEYKEWTSNSASQYNVADVKEFLENNHEDHIHQTEQLWEALDKAMTAEVGDRVTSKESVEGGQKVLDKLEEDRKLKKSEVYEMIFAKYGDVIDNNIKKAQQIYKLTQEFNTKLYNMEGNETISKALEKSFEFIDQQIDLIKSQAAAPVSEENKEEAPVADIEKSQTEETASVEETKEEEKTELEKSEEVKEEAPEAEAKPEEIEKGQSDFSLAIMSFVKSEISKGATEEEIIDGLVEKGLDAEFCTVLVKSALDEMNNSDANGSLDSTQVVPAIQKSEESDISKAESLDLIKSEMLSFFEKSQENLYGQLEQRFVALGSLMKSQGEEIMALKTREATTHQALMQANETLSKIANTPVGTRSIIKSSQIVPRFDSEIQKSEEGIELFDLRKGEDVAELTARLSAEFDLQKSKGIDNKPLADALFEISVAKSLDRQTMHRMKSTFDNLKIRIA